MKTWEEIRDEVAGMLAFKMQFRGWLKGEHHDSVQG